MFIFLINPFQINAPSVSTSFVSKFTCNSTRIFKYICCLSPSSFFFDKNTFIQKRRWKKEPFVLARFTPAESGEIKLYRPRYLEYFPRYLTRLRFPKIYESARDLTRDSVCESRCDTTPLFHQFPRKLRCLLSFNR